MKINYFLNHFIHISAARPVVHEGFREEFVHPKSRISMLCVISGNPLPSVTWTLDDGPLPTNSRFSTGQRVTQQGDIYSYVNITKTEIADGGTYKCTGKNDVGQAVHSAQLYIYGKIFKSHKISQRNLHKYRL